MQYPVLILNTDYRPFDVWNWKKTMRKLVSTNNILPIYNDKGIVKHDKLIRDGQGNIYDLPAVVILTKFINVHSGKAPYTKMNIYARDLFYCQYCGELTTHENRTIDHVIPRAHWNSRRYHFKLNSFENVVTCCVSCNMKKRNRTPAQADMKLIRTPKKISKLEVYKNKLSLIKNKPKQWNNYINND